MPRRRAFFFLGAAPQGRARTKGVAQFLITYSRRGIATASHQAAEPQPIVRYEWPCRRPLRMPSLVSQRDHWFDSARAQGW